MEDSERPEIVRDGRITRRRMLFGAAGAWAAAFLAACGDDDDSSSATTGGATATTKGARRRPAADRPRPGVRHVGAGSTDVATLLQIDPASAGKGKTVDLGAVLALTGTGSFYGKTMSRGLDLAAKHIVELGGPTFKYTYLDHKSGDPAAGVQAMAELVSKGIQAKFASYGDDITAMLSSTSENKVFTFDGGGGTGITAQGKPYFWGTRAITPNDPMPGLFKWTKEAYPDAKTVGVVQWDLGADNNAGTKADVVAKLQAAGYQFNNLYELVPIGGQDFSQVLPKVKANEPDILLLVIYGQDPGSFTNQAATAGLKAVRIGFEFTPDGLNASKGTYDSEGWTFAYDYFDAKNPTNPLAKKFVDDFKSGQRRGPRLLRRQLLRERLRHVGPDAPDLEDRPQRQDHRRGAATALETDLTLVSVYGGDDTHLGSFTLDEKTHSVIDREMGVFEYKGGTVTAKAFFGIGGVDYRTA